MYALKMAVLLLVVGAVGSVTLATSAGEPEHTRPNEERWLGMFGSDLLKEFELDPFTLLVRTTCLY